MIVNNELTEFLESYLPTKLPNYKISGHNFMVDCIFCGGTKKKLGIDFRTGKYHCFHGSCGVKGEFVNLYSILENISISKAHIDLNYKVLLNDNTKPKQYKNLVRSYCCEEELESAIPVHPDSYDSNLDIVKLAWTYLMSRKLFDLNNPTNNNFLVVETGFYSDRIIIPYVHENKIIYFQARALKSGMKPKYLCAQNKIRGADILYPFDLKQNYVVVCEGPVDARSLQLQGVNATCTTGVAISNTQIDSLRMFGGRIIIGYDNDIACTNGIKSANRLRKKKMIPELYYCHPPQEFKDWNEAHQKDFDLKTYIQKETKLWCFDNYVLSAIDAL